jgi:hypothetical protein
MGGSGKKARAKANKAKKKMGGEAATPPPAPPAAAVPSFSSVQRPEEESTYGAEWLAEEEEDLRSLQTAMTKFQAAHASTDASGL